MSGISRLRSCWLLKLLLNPDLRLNYTDQLRATIDTTPESSGSVDFVGVVLQLAWVPLKTLWLSSGDQNLTDNRHSEFQSDYVVDTGTERSVYAQLKLEF